jgi:methylenetetrahydrofolate dehydrogenase (NADP+)/methenyltetrahydrofolate cyclohydrolase/formyltetrahydrofolate synthetase
MRAGDWVKPGAVVIDCGINVNETKEPGAKSIYGDVDFDGVKKIAGHITPVPGGVGPMTVAMLLRNTLDQAVKRRLNVSCCTQFPFHIQSFCVVTKIITQLQANLGATWKICALPLEPHVPVPSDIAISRAQKPKFIDDLAEEVSPLQGCHNCVQGRHTLCRAGHVRQE